MKVTIDLEAKLYRAIKAKAARSGRSVSVVTEEALEAWLDAIETREDIEAAHVALDEYAHHGGADAEAFFEALAAV